MRKKILIVLSALFATVAIFAQDVIITTNSEKIECKITEVSKSEIKYKEKDNPDGPTFVLSTDEINSIIYSNGKVVLYDKPSEKVEKQPAQTATIVLLSGYILSGELLEMTNKHVAYLDNGVRKTIPGSQIKTVTLSNGQVKNYEQLANAVKEETLNIKKEETLDIKKPEQSKNNCRIYRDEGNYMYDNKYISVKEVERILERENPAAYNQWKKGNGMQIGGGVCLGIGSGLVIGGLITLIQKNYGACIGIECASLVPLGIGLGLTLGSSKCYNKAINIYNSKCDHTAVQMKWGFSANGVGLAFVF